MAHLFSHFRLRELDFRNRIFVSPMCQYSAVDGMPNDWHMVHLGSRAVGGAGLVMAEATSVTPEGRISPGDTGLWSDAHADAFARINKFVESQGAVPGIQLAHAGRKASLSVPWEGGGPLKTGAWETIGPSAVPYDSGWPAPRELSTGEILDLVDQFAAATHRAAYAGFKVIELHMAHGYLLHEFLSPLSNLRNDDYGGSFENRIRLPLAVARSVRLAWPPELPLFVRLSATDWAGGGWDLEDSIRFSRELKNVGVDLIDCSSGGLVPYQTIKVEPGYQVPFAREIRKSADIATAAVGLITEAAQADGIIRDGEADAVFLAREFLRNPYWPRVAAAELGQNDEWPKQYDRAKPRNR